MATYMAWSVSFYAEINLVLNCHYWH